MPSRCHARECCRDLHDACRRTACEFVTLICRTQCRQSDENDCAIRRTLFDPQVASMVLNDLLRDGEPQAGAVGLTVSKKWLEDLLLMIVGGSTAVVGNANLHL